MFFNQSKAERAARIRVAAQQLNFSYVEQSTLPHFLIATDNSVFNHHKQYPTVENVLYCQSNGVEISLFDYTYSQQRYSTNTPYAGRTETFNQTIASLRKGSCHQSIFYKYQQLIEPENIRMFLDEAFKAYNHELFIQSYRDRARFHLQVEVLSVQERVPLLDCKPFNVSVKARVVRILRGDESLRVGDAVMFTLTVAQEGKSGNSIVPKSIRYSKLLEAGFLEVFLNGQPPNCHVPLVTEPPRHEPEPPYFADITHLPTDELMLKFYYNPKRILAQMDMSWKTMLKNLVRPEKIKKPRTHP